MPDLARVATEYENEVGFIGLLADYGSNMQGAARIMENAEAPASFITVDSETPGLEPLLRMTMSGFLPTSVFIDGEGRMVIDQLVGSFGDYYGTLIEELLANH